MDGAIAVKRAAAGARTARGRDRGGPHRPRDRRRGLLSAAPLWFLGERLLEHLPGLEGPPFELADLFQRGADAGLAIAPVEIGKTRDLTTAVDLVVENFPYLASLT